MRILKNMCSSKRVCKCNCLNVEGTVTSKVPGEETDMTGSEYRVTYCCHLAKYVNKQVSLKSICR